MQTVAIITRTKDRPTFLRRAIESVANQTYTDYVHVIVNDGGDRKQVEEVIAKFPSAIAERVKLFHRPQASNAPDTIFNESIARVKSELIVIHDDDDTWHPDFLRLSVERLADEPTIMGVVTRTDKIIEELQSNGKIKRIRTERWMPHVKAINLYRQCAENQLTPIAFLYRRTAYDILGGYDDALPVIGDWDFGIRFLQKFDIDYIDPGYALANYHHRKYKPNTEGNTSAAGNDRARYYTNLLMNNYLRRELTEGRLGVGYIMNKVRYNESSMAELVRRVLPKAISSRLEKRAKH